MPVIYKDEKKGKILCLQFDRCKGCDLCINICPKNVLEKSKTLNRNVQYPPAMKADAECSLCNMCALVCPDFSIYIVPMEVA